MGATGHDAADRLRELNTYYRQHPVTSAAGHSYISSAPRATASEPAAPFDVDVVDHIQASLHEVVADTLAINPHPAPLPARVEAVYAWYIDNTSNAADAQRQRRDTIVYRQGLEHAIAMGNTKVIRPHRCPQCRTVGLMWQGAAGRAACTNRRCLDDDGMTTTWTLAQLAYEHIAAIKNHGRVSAT